MTVAEKQVILTALAWGHAKRHFEQNECEIANGGRDLGRDTLKQDLGQAETDLDDALYALFGDGFDLCTLDKLKKQVTG